MKVTHKYGIGSFSGTIDLGVFRPSKSGLTSIMRRWVYPKLTAQNEALGIASGNLRAVWAAASAGFKTDWQTYCSRYNSENPPTNGFDAGWTSYGAFTKMMYAWAASDPSHVELSAISPEDMGTIGAVVASVELCVELGLVPAVSNYTDLSTSY